MILALSVRSESRIGVWQTAGFIVGFLGALVVFSPWQNFHVDVFGAALCLLAAVSYAVSYVYMGRYLAGTKLSSVSLSAYQLLIAAAMLALTLPFDPSRRATLDLQSILAIVVLGALGTGIAYIINYTLIRTDGAARASTVTYVVPIVAVVLGVFVANEPLTITLVTGITLVLIGVSMIRKRVQ